MWFARAASHTSRVAAGARDWTTCPGCGLTLPDARPTTDRRLRASSACLDLYDEVVAHGLADPRLAGSHQLRVDAYTAQHVGEETPAIGIAFALIGLHLALERDFTGAQVRAAHTALAAVTESWPRFGAPADPGALTIFDLAAADARAHAAALERWARSVWEAWSHARGAVASLAERHRATIARAAAHAG